jgi:hypothetical protein
MKRKSLNRDDQQFHQFKQSEKSPQIIEHKKDLVVDFSFYDCRIIV